MSESKITKFWAIHYGILKKVQKGLTPSKASKIFKGEQLAAVNYFKKLFISQILLTRWHLQ